VSARPFRLMTPFPVGAFFRIMEGIELMIFRDVADGVEIAVKVVPGSTRTRILGPLGDALKVAVSAPPEKGKANQAVVRLLAEVLGTARRAITVVSGQTSPKKVILIKGGSVETCRRKLLSPAAKKPSRGA